MFDISVSAFKFLDHNICSFVLSVTICGVSKTQSVVNVMWWPPPSPSSPFKHRKLISASFPALTQPHQVSLCSCSLYQHHQLHNTMVCSVVKPAPPVSEDSVVESCLSSNNNNLAPLPPTLPPTIEIKIWNYIREV